MFVVVLFVFIEWAASRNGVNLSGYATYQIKTIHRYNAVLLELGEKWYSPSTTEMSVEMRIVGIALIQAAIFFAGRFVESKFGIPATTVHEIIDTKITGGAGVPPSSSYNNSGNVNTPFDSRTQTAAAPPRSSTHDAQGLPMAPGTEDAIYSADCGGVAGVAANASAVGGGSAPRGAASSAPVFDLGGLLGGLLGGGGGGIGDKKGGADIGNLVSTAMSFLSSANQQQQPSQQQQSATAPQTPFSSSKGTSPSLPPRSSPIGAGGAYVTANRKSPTSPSVFRASSPPRSTVRKAPVFNNDES